MRPTATDGVAWSVGLSVTIMNPAKMAELIDDREMWLWWAQASRNDVLDGPRYQFVNGQFWGRKGSGPGLCPAVDILAATQQGTEPARCGLPDVGARKSKSKFVHKVQDN